MSLHSSPAVATLVGAAGALSSGLSLLSGLAGAASRASSRPHAASLAVALKATKGGAEVQVLAIVAELAHVEVHVDGAEDAVASAAGRASRPAAAGGRHRHSRCINALISIAPIVALNPPEKSTIFTLLRDFFLGLVATVARERTTVA